MKQSSIHPRAERERRKRRGPFAIGLSGFELEISMEEILRDLDPGFSHQLIALDERPEKHSPSSAG